MTRDGRTLRTRGGDVRDAGLLVKSWVRVPVFHAPDYGKPDVWGKDDYYPTRCGKAGSDFLPIMHLLKFARPCRKCWEQNP